MTPVGENRISGIFHWFSDSSSTLKKPDEIPQETKVVNPSEVEKNSWLNDPSFKNELKNFKLFALESADPFINKTVFEGNGVTESIDRFINCLSRALEHVPQKFQVPFSIFSKAQIRAKRIEKLIFEGRDKTEEERKALIKNCAHELLTHVSQMKPGEEFWLPGGWTDKFAGGHALFYRIICQSKDKFSWTIFNTGSGLEYHHQSTTLKGEVHYQSFLMRENIASGDLCQEEFFQALLKLIVCSLWKPEVAYSAKNIYEGILEYLGGTSPSAIDPNKFPYLYMKSQRSGNCSIKILFAVLRWSMIEECKKKGISFREAINQYKIVKYYYKRQSLLDACHHFFSSPQWNRTHHKLISDVASKFASSAKKLGEKRLLPSEELEKCEATFRHIKAALKAKKADHFNDLKTNPSLITADVFTQRPPPSKVKILNVGVPFPDLKQEFTPQTMASLLSEWGDIATRETEGEIFEAISEQMKRFIGKLPMPSNDKENFWSKIPVKDREQCILNLKKIARIYWLFDVQIRGQVFYFTLNCIIAKLSDEPEVKRQIKKRVEEFDSEIQNKIASELFPVEQIRVGQLCYFAGHLEGPRQLEKSVKPIHQIPEIPFKDDLKPEQMADLLNNWESSLHQLIVEKAPIPLVIDTIERCMRALPVPVKNSTTDFWCNVGEIEKCMEGLFKISRLIFKSFEKHKRLSESSFIALHTALAIGDKLARRCPENRLEGHKLSYYELVAFAQSTHVKLLNPEDQKQLDAILAYFNDEFDLTRLINPNDLEAARKKALFTYIINLDITYSEPHKPCLTPAMLTKEPNLKFLSQFVWDSQIADKIKVKYPEATTPFAKVGKLYSEKLDDPVLPKSLLYLRQLATFCWVSPCLPENLEYDDFEMTFEGWYQNEYALMLVSPKGRKTLSFGIFHLVFKQDRNFFKDIGFSDREKEVEEEMETQNRSLSTFYIREHKGQNALMKNSDYIAAGCRDEVIISLEPLDEVVRILAYFQEGSEILLEKKSFQKILTHHLFAPNRLLPQIISEPRVALKLIYFINVQLDRYKSKRNWMTCLFLAFLGNRCAAYIDMAKKQAPERFIKLSKEFADIPDYRKALLQGILPHCSTLEFRAHAMLALATMHLSTDEINLKPAQFTELAQDLISYQMYSTKCILEKDNKEAEQLFLHFLPKIQKLLDNDSLARNEILNEVASRCTNSRIQVEWQGKYPYFEGANFQINIDDANFFNNGVLYFINFPLESMETYKELLGQVDSVTSVAKGLYQIKSKRGLFFLSTAGNSFRRLYREIEGKQYRLQPLNSSEVSFIKTVAEISTNWFCEEPNPYFIFELQDGKRYYLDVKKVFSKNFTDTYEPISMSDDPIRKRILVKPGTSYLMDRLNVFETPSHIACWQMMDSFLSIDGIDFPRYNLHFNKEGERYFCQEVPGFYISQNQEADFNYPLNSYLILENNTGQRKLLLPQEMISNNAADELIVFDPEITLLRKSINDKPNVIVCDLEEHDGEMHLKPLSEESALYISYVCLEKKRYQQSLYYLQKAYGLKQYTVEEIFLLLEMLKGNDQHPSAVTLRLHIAVMLEENKQKYAPKEIGHLTIPTLAEEYCKYLSNPPMSTLFQLTLAQEKALMRLFLIYDQENEDNIKLCSLTPIVSRWEFLKNGKKAKIFKPKELPILSERNLLQSFFSEKANENEENEKKKKIQSFLSELKNNKNAQNLDLELLVNPSMTAFTHTMPELYALAKGERGPEGKARVQRYLKLLEGSELISHAQFTINVLKSVLASPRSFPTLVEVIRADYTKEEEFIKLFLKKYREFAPKKGALIHSKFLPNATISDRKVDESLEIFPASSPHNLSVDKFCLDEDQRLNHSFKQMSDKYFKTTNGKPSLVDLQTELKKLVEDGQRSLEQLQKEIETLMKEQSPDLNTLEALRRAGQKQQLQLHQALNLFEEGKLDEYKKLTVLSDQQIDLLEKKSLQFLILATRLEQAKRTFEYTRQHEMLQETDERVLMKQRIADELSTEREYFHLDNYLIRSFLVFEYRNKLILRKKQVNFLVSIINHPNPLQLLAQLGTGSGKSKVIATLLQWARTKCRRLIINLWPTALYPENRQDMKRQVDSSFGQRADTFDFDRAYPTTLRNLKFIQDEFRKAIDERRQLNGKPESVQNFELKFLEILRKFNHNNVENNGFNVEFADGHIGNFQDALKKFAYGEAHIDEGHINLSPRREVNFTVGESGVESAENVEFIESLYRLMCTDPIISPLLRLKENKQFLLWKKYGKENGKILDTSPLYKDIIAPTIANKMATNLDIPEFRKDEFIQYVLGQINHVPAWIPEHPQRSQIGLLRGELRLLLPSTLNGKVNTNFGLSHLPKKLSPPEYAKPYDASDSPVEHADYDNIHETLNKTYQTYLIERLTSEQEWNLVTNLQASALSEAKYLNIDPKQTKAYIFYKENFPSNIGDLFLLNEADIEKWHEQIKDSDEVVYAYIRKFIVPKIRKFKWKLKSDSQNLRYMFGNLMTMTATPGATKTYGTGMEYSPDEGSDERVLETMSRKCDHSNSIHVVPSSEPNEVLDNILKGLFKKGSDFRMLIDIGSLLAGMSNAAVAKAMLAHFIQEDPSKNGIQGVVFCDKNDQLVILERGRENPLPLGASTLLPEKRATYCANKQIFGLDTKQFPKAKAAVTCDIDTHLDASIQGVGRLREFLKDQSIEWVLMDESKKAICGENPISFSILLELFWTNKKLYDAENLYRSFKQQMHNEIRKVLMKKLREASTVHETLRLFSSFEKFLVDAIVEDPFELYGQEDQEIPSVQSLLNYKKRMLNFLNILQGLSKEEKKGIATNLNAYEEKIKEAEKELPRYVKESTDKIGTEVQRNIETDVATRQEQASSSDISLYKHSESEWPDSLNIFNGEWFKHSYYYVRPLENILKRIINVSIRIINTMSENYRSGNWRPFIVTVIIICISGASIYFGFVLVALKTVLFLSTFQLSTLLVGLALSVGVIGASFLARMKILSPCPIYRVHDVLKRERESDIAQAAHFFKGDETTELLLTNNFVRKKTGIFEFSVDALSAEQKPLYEVLVIQDELSEDQKKTTMIMGDQWTDMHFWRKKLIEDCSTDQPHNKRKICIYDLKMGIVQDSKNPFDEEELRTDPAFQKLLTLAKIYNGEVDYTDEQFRQLQMMVKEPKMKEKMTAFFKKALVWHSSKAERYVNSPIDFALRT